MPHHVTQRGNNRRDIFFNDGDRDTYLRLLHSNASEYAVDILGYCLMTNHVHIVATPSTETGLAKALGLTHNDYSRWLNIRRGESGHVWQNRFLPCGITLFMGCFGSSLLRLARAYTNRRKLRWEIAELEKLQSELGDSSPAQSRGWWEQVTSHLVNQLAMVRKKRLRI